MHRIFSRIFILLMFANVVPAMAQTPAAFTPDSATFIKEMNTFFDQVNPNFKPEAKKALRGFTTAWKSGKISEFQRQHVYKTANFMLKSRMRAYPQFSEYLYCYTALIQSWQNDSSMVAWTKGLENTINSKSYNAFMAYLESVGLLLKEKKIFSSGYMKWICRTDTFYFVYDSTPRVIFPSLDLICIADKDSSVIKKTSGIFFPGKDLWMGKGGIVSWKRAGMADVYAQIDLYQLNLRLASFTADTVLFYFKKLFNRPLTGSLQEKMLSKNSEERAIYPKFISYEKSINLPNVFENIDYEGGFTMEGARIIGSGANEQPAIITFRQNGKVFARAYSRNFIIRSDRISSDRAAISIYYETDSIHHPGLTMRYLDTPKQLSFTRSDDGLAISPFFDSFHKMDMYFEAMNWSMKENKIDFEMIKGIKRTGEATFESSNYFSEPRFEKLQGIDEVNPLYLIYKFSEATGNSNFYGYELSDFIKMPISQVQAMLINLAGKGFLIYNTETDRVSVKPRLFDYLKAKAKKIDYDVIRFNSVVTKESNATLDIPSFDLIIRGVPEVQLSDSQMVFIYPANEQIRLKKNRDFIFTGRVHAGYFDFYAHECSFEYDKFKLNLPTIDSMSFSVHDTLKNREGKYPLVRVKTVIADLSGDLLIDNPNNKSSLKSYKVYPVFNSKTESYAYYDRKTIQKGVYDRDKFYYHVNPFTIDSLANFTTDGLEFNGFLVSGDIFPDIVEPLKVQRDFSLGFVKKLPEEGYSAYQDKGTFYSKVTLSNEGLIGVGTLRFLGSVSKSNRFIFYPDSTNARVNSFELAEKATTVEYPKAHAADANFHWQPYQDCMTISNLKAKTIAMYNDSAWMDGKIFLATTGLTGSGTLRFNAAEMNSRSFSFYHHTFDTDTTDFRLKTLEKAEIAFSTHFNKSHIDLEKRIGEFRNKGVGSKVEFPVNQYICYMDQLDWLMDKSEINLINNISERIPGIEQMSSEQLADADLRGSEFISVNPVQDSLSFYCFKASYNLKETIIHAENVKLIHTGDAAVFPARGEVTILQKAKMKELEDALILANRTTKYHRIYNADVSVLSRMSYRAKGYSDYIDENDGMQPVFFSNIYYDSISKQTVGFARISDSANFTLSPDFDFAGNIQLNASKEFLTFDGGFRIKHDCDVSQRYWVKFTFEVNPRNILLPVNYPHTDIKGLPLYSSMMFSEPDGRVYPLFLASAGAYPDSVMMRASGFIRFDKSFNEYRIASEARLNDAKAGGNYLSFNRERCIVYGEGKLNLTSGLAQVQAMNYGRFRHFIIPDSTTFESMMTIDFFFSESAMKKLENDLESATDLKAVNLTSDVYSHGLIELVGKDDAQKINNEINLYGSIKKMPAGLNHTLVFTDLRFSWNPNIRSFVSQGPIGIGNIGKNQINKYVNGYVELAKRRTGDIITIYLELKPSQWYFFTYSNSTLQAISSNEDFNGILSGLKESKRTVKSKNEEESYLYIISTPEKRIQFLRKMQGVE